MSPSGRELLVHQLWSYSCLSCVFWFFPQAEGSFSFYLIYRHNIKDSGMYNMNECLDHIMHTDGVQRGSLCLTGAFRIFYACLDTAHSHTSL